MKNGVKGPREVVEHAGQAMLACTVVTDKVAQMLGEGLSGDEEVVDELYGVSAILANVGRECVTLAGGSWTLDEGWNEALAADGEEGIR